MRILVQSDEYKYNLKWYSHFGEKNVSDLDILVINIYYRDTHCAEGGMIRMLIEVICKKNWKQPECLSVVEKIHTNIFVK